MSEMVDFQMGMAATAIAVLQDYVPAPMTTRSH